MKTNTHGMKMIGLKKTAGETKNAHLGCVHVYYDRATGEVWGEFSASVNSYTVYDDPRIIPVCTAQNRMTMQEIADIIRIAVYDAEAREARNAEIEAAYK